MSNNERGARFWIRAWLPVAIGIAVIATESTSYFGADHTSGPLLWVWEHIFGPVASGHWDTIHHYIRKTGHFVGYGILGLFWLRGWWMTRPCAGFMANAILAVLGTAVIATGDEFHQTFLPNRTGLPTDVLIDCSGAIVTMLLLYLALRVLAPNRLARTA